MKAIITKFHGPTNTLGARYSASDCDGNRVTIGCDHRLDSDGRHMAAAVALCKKMNWHGTLVGGWLGKEMAWVWSDDRYSKAPTVKIEPWPEKKDG